MTPIMNADIPRWNDNYRVTEVPIFDCEHFNVEQARRQFSVFDGFSPLDSINAYAVVLDANARIFYLNDNVCQLLKVSLDDVFKSHWIEDFIPIDQHLEMQQLFRAAMGGITEPFLHYVNDVQDRYGDIHSLFWLNKFIYDGIGRVIGSVSLGFDSTELNSGLTLNIPLDLNA